MGKGTPAGRVASPWFRASKGSWYVWHRGRQVSLGKGTREEALEAHARLRLGLAARESPEGSGSLSGLLGSFLEAKGREVARGDLARITLEGYARLLGPLRASPLGRSGIEGLRASGVSSWLDSRPWGPTTRRNAIVALRAALRWAVDSGDWPGIPAGLLRLRAPQAKTREKLLSEHDLRAILAALPKGDPWRDLIEALSITGARPIELEGLTRARVDREARRIWVRDKIRGATGSPDRPIVITARLWEILSRRLRAAGPDPGALLFPNGQGKQWTRNARALRWARLRKRLDLSPGATAYGLRHLFVIRALDRGLEAADIAALIGHRDSRMIERVYGHWRKTQGARIARAAEKAAE